MTRCRLITPDLSLPEFTSWKIAIIMTYDNKSVIGWAFVMVAFNVIPYATVYIAEPSGFHMVGILVVIGFVAGLVGRMFND